MVRIRLSPQARSASRHMAGMDGTLGTIEPSPWVEQGSGVMASCDHGVFPQRFF